MLYIVGTPIGNMNDISLRALLAMRDSDLIVAEDTRETQKIVNTYNLKHRKLTSLHRHNEKEKTEELIKMLKEGKNLVLVSDAGMPGICDPGAHLIKRAIEEDLKIEHVPGPTALITALVGSGLNTEEFMFLGFLPLNKKNRKAKLEMIKNSTVTTILYEAPHKIQKTLIDLKEVIGDRKVVLARELTKLFEEFLRYDIDTLIEKTAELRGEMVILIEGGQPSDENKFEEMSLEEHYKYYEDKGFEKKEIIKKMAKDRGVPKDNIYKKFI